jgi:hypothetical protein
MVVEWWKKFGLPPSPAIVYVSGGDGRGNLARYKGVDDEWGGHERGDDTTVAKRGKVGDDDLSQELQTCSTTERIVRGETIVGSIGVRTLPGRHGLLQIG